MTGSRRPPRGRLAVRGPGRNLRQQGDHLTAPSAARRAEQVVAGERRIVTVPPQIPYKINWLDRNGEAEPASSAGRRILFLYLARLPRKITGNVDPILLVFEDQSAEPEERGAADPQGFDRSLRR